MDCNPGFHKNASNECITNTCKCPNGTVVPGDDCLINNSNKCLDCNPGFHKNASNECITNTCICPNGTEVTGDDCLINNSNKCLDCNPGFHKNASNECITNTCKCPNGTVVPGVACTSTKTCSTCMWVDKKENKPCAGNTNASIYNLEDCKKQFSKDKIKYAIWWANSCFKAKQCTNTYDLANTKIYENKCA